MSGIRTHDLCDAGAVLSQLSYQSHMRAVVYGLALYMGTFRLGPCTVKSSLHAGGWMVGKKTGIRNEVAILGSRGQVWAE